MNFVHPLLEKAISINEGELRTLVIENPVALRNTVRGIMNAETEYVLSKDFSPVDISRYAEFVTDMFSVDFAEKKILTKLSAEAERISENYPDETFSLIKAMNDYAELISHNLDYPIKFSMTENAEKLIKLMNFTVDEENMSFPEVLLTYMELCRSFFGKQIFIFLNLKAFVSDDEFELFCKNIAYEQFRVLLIEAFDVDKSAEYEKKIIIDKDLCIIGGDNL